MKLLLIISKRNENKNKKFSKILGKVFTASRNQSVELWESNTKGREERKKSLRILNFSMKQGISRGWRSRPTLVVGGKFNFQDYEAVASAKKYDGTSKKVWRNLAIPRRFGQTPKPISISIIPFFSPFYSTSLLLTSSIYPVVDSRG